MTLPDLLLILALITGSQVVIAVFLFRRQDKFLKSLKDPREQKLLHQAMKKSQDILGEAELEGVKIVADSKYYTKELGKIYESQLTEAANRMEKEFSWMVGRAEEELERFQKAKANQFSGVIETALTSFTDQLMKAREEQKRQLLAKAEKEVAGMVATVAKKVLGKSLTDSENAELIAKALEEAKQEGFVK